LIHNSYLAELLGLFCGVLCFLCTSPKTKAELEEIALAEADVARLKQKVAELHLQLNQQRQHQYGSSTDANDRYQHLPSLLSQ
jgi:hypothetical protein